MKSSVTLAWAEHIDAKPVNFQACVDRYPDGRAVVRWLFPQHVVDDLPAALVDSLKADALRLAREQFDRITVEEVTAA